MIDYLKKFFTKKDTKTMFTKLTRVYVQKSDKKKVLKEQTVTVRLSEIAMVRASNRLGLPGHRATVTLASGISIDTGDTAAQVNAKLGFRG